MFHMSGNSGSRLFCCHMLSEHWESALRCPPILGTSLFSAAQHCSGKELCAKHEAWVSKSFGRGRIVQRRWTVLDSHLSSCNSAKPLSACWWQLQPNCRLGFLCTAIKQMLASSGTAVAWHVKSFLYNRAYHCVAYIAPLILPKSPFSTCADLFPSPDVLSAVIAGGRG